MTITEGFFNGKSNSKVQVVGNLYNDIVKTIKVGDRVFNISEELYLVSAQAARQLSYRLYHEFDMSGLWDYEISCYCVLNASQSIYGCPVFMCGKEGVKYEGDKYSAFYWGNVIAKNEIVDPNKAIYDVDGWGNTEYMLASNPRFIERPNYYIWSASKIYAPKNMQSTKGKWYVPSLGEAVIACENWWNIDNTPKPAHTSNLTPCIWTSTAADANDAWHLTDDQPNRLHGYWYYAYGRDRKYACKFYIKYDDLPVLNLDLYCDTEDEMRKMNLEFLKK